MIINPYALAVSGGGGGGDPYFADVGLLVHCGSSLVDSSSHALPVTVNGTPFLNSTDQAVGADCSDMANVAGGTAAGSYLTVAAAPGGPIDMSAGDYTAEAFVFLRAPGNVPFCTTYLDHMMILNNSVYGEGGSGTVATIPFSQWNHLAFVMHANAYTLYVNGVQQFTPNPVTRQTWAAETWYLGGYQFGAGLNGMAQEWRLTKGVARYLANFTPPTAPFPDH